VRDLVASRVPLFEYAIRSAVSQFDLDTIEGRLAALDAAAPIVARIKDRGHRHQYAISLDRWLGMMDETFVLARVRDHAGSGGQPSSAGRRPAGRPSGQPAGGRGPAGRPPGGAGPRNPAGPGSWESAVPVNGEAGRNGAGSHDPNGAAPYDPNDPAVQVEREVLKLAVQRPGLCGPAFASLGTDAFTVAAHAGVFSLICTCGGWDKTGETSDVSAPGAAGGVHPLGGREWARSLREAAPDDQTKTLVTELAVEPMHTPGADGEPDARYVTAQLATVEELAVSRQIAHIKSRLQRMDPKAAQAEHARLFGDLVGLEQRRKVLVGLATGGS
jgi:DNA primase